MAMDLSQGLQADAQRRKEEESLQRHQELMAALRELNELIVKLTKKQKGD